MITGPKNSLPQVGLLGVRGYAGQVLHALLMHHPCMRPRVIDHREPSPEALAECDGCVAIAMAIPEDASRAWAGALREQGHKVIDLSGAHRQIEGVHYGLPELMGPPPPDSTLVANPGCYPTAALMALAPLRRAGIIEDRPIAVVGESGTSGAGKGLRDDLHFSELHANFFPYKVGVHRHVPEIERYLEAEVSFVPQLMPIVRGLMITAFVQPKGSATPADLQGCLRDFYAPHPYATVLPETGAGLGVRHVVGTHQAVLAVGPVARGGLVPVFASIDNLMRGAASQALHNLNLWLGHEPFAGLPDPMTSPPDGVPGMNRSLP